MAGSEDGVELSQLQAALDRSLVSYLRRLSFAVPRSRSRRTATSAAASLRGSGVHRGAGGEPVFHDDERRLRALAKEIKHLISEDKRRGIGV